MSDPVIEAYKKDIDRTLLRENLRLTPEQRIQKLAAFIEFLDELRRAGANARSSEATPGSSAEREAGKEERRSSGAASGE